MTFWVSGFLPEVLSCLYHLTEAHAFAGFERRSYASQLPADDIQSKRGLKGVPCGQVQQARHGEQLETRASQRLS